MSKNGLDQFAMRSLDDWRFFFQHAGASMGIHAIDYDRWAASSRGASRGAVAPQQRQLDAAARHARIERSLAAMGRADLQLVKLIADEDPRELWLPFGMGGLGNLADRSLVAARALVDSRSTRELSGWLDRLGARLLRGRATTEDRVQRERIASDCEWMVYGLHERYEQRRRMVA